MSVDVQLLTARPSIVRISIKEETRLALWQDGTLLDLTAASDASLHSFDRLLALPLARIRELLDDPAIDRLPALDPAGCNLMAPVESQEVWAAGVTYLRSREARMEEATVKDVYSLVYEAERPELFFKAAGWRVVGPGGEVGVRSDSSWDVPEPELAALSNAHGEVIAYACGNDVSSRSIEGENPLYLPQAKVYDAGCAIGPAAVLAWHVSPEELAIHMTIERSGEQVFRGEARVAEMVRDPAELMGVLHAVYTLPAGAWLLTGTSIVPAEDFTLQPGDQVTVEIDGLGILRNRVRVVEHSGAAAPPRTSR